MVKILFFRSCAWIINTCRDVIIIRCALFRQKDKIIDVSTQKEITANNPLFEQKFFNACCPH